MHLMCCIRLSVLAFSAALFAAYIESSASLNTVHFNAQMGFSACLNNSSQTDVLSYEPDTVCDCCMHCFQNSLQW